jgi:hypothetical protein
MRGGRNGTEILIDVREKEGKGIELKKKGVRIERDKLSIFPKRLNFHVLSNVTNRRPDIATLFRSLSASIRGESELG